MEPTHTIGPAAGSLIVILQRQVARWSDTRQQLVSFHSAGPVKPSIMASSRWLIAARAFDIDRTCAAAVPASVSEARTAAVSVTTLSTRLRMALVPACV
jgi:hypothetical protein